MKHQKVVALIILLLSAAFAFTSCNNDGYSLDKFWLEVGTIEKTSDQDYKIILDKGPVLYPSISNVPARYLENNMRVYADFTILQDANPGSSVDHYVRVNDLQKLLTKPIYLTPKRLVTAWVQIRLNCRNIGLPTTLSPSDFSMPEALKNTWST